MYVCGPTCMYVDIHVCMWTYMYVCGPTCMYVGMCMRLNYVTAKAVEHYFIGNNLRSVST